jgi:hypothetical protein
MSKRDMAFWLFILVGISLCIYLYFYLSSESYDCMKSPLVYGVSKYQTNQGEFLCRCSSLNSPTLIVSKDGMTQEQNPYSVFTS